MALAVIMLLSTVGMTAYAEGVDTPVPYEKEGFTYVCFGDSYTRGMGCSDNWEEETDIEFQNGEYQRRNITGAYPYLVATNLGCDTETENGYLNDPDSTYWPLVQNGQRVAGVLDFFGVDDNYYDSYFYHGIKKSGLRRGHAVRYDRFVKYFGNPDSVYPKENETFGAYGSVYDARDLVKAADLLTVQLGMADVLNRPIYAAAQECLPTGNLNFDGAETEDIVKFAAKVIENMYEGYEYFERAYPMLVEYLTNLNRGEGGKNGTIILLSMANPMFGINISDDILLPIGNVFSVITAKANTIIKKTAEKYGVIYLDISNVDTSSNEYDWTISDVLDGNDDIATHPSPNGHKQIANMILNAYNNQNKPVTKNIVLDLGRFDNVSYVMLDDRILSPGEYTVEKPNGLTSVLTIKNKSTHHDILTVAVDKGKNIAASVYKLEYESDSGYSAYRLYTTNGVFNLLRPILDLFKNLSDSVMNVFKLPTFMTSFK